MKNTTFCMLLISALMIMCGVTVCLVRDHAETERSSMEVSAERETRTWIWPLKGKRVEGYGAQYSEEYGQWMLREHMSIEAGEDKEVCAPVRGVIAKIESAENGCCVEMKNGEMTIRLWPIEGVRIFEGSVAEEGMVLGRTEGWLHIRIEENGAAVDPNQLFKVL